MPYGFSGADRLPFPIGDTQRLKEMGDEINRRFSSPIAKTLGQKKSLTLNLGKKQTVNYCIIQENIKNGERIRQYKIEAKVNGKNIQKKPVFYR